MRLHVILCGVLLLLTVLVTVVAYEELEIVDGIFSSSSCYRKDFIGYKDKNENNIMARNGNENNVGIPQTCNATTTPSYCTGSKTKSCCPASINVCCTLSVGRGTCCPDSCYEGSNDVCCNGWACKLGQNCSSSHGKCVTSTTAGGGGEGGVITVVIFLILLALCCVGGIVTCCLKSNFSPFVRRQRVMAITSDDVNAVSGYNNNNNNNNVNNNNLPMYGPTLQARNEQGSTSLYGNSTNIALSPLPSYDAHIQQRYNNWNAAGGQTWQQQQQQQPNIVINGPLYDATIPPPPLYDPTQYYFNHNDNNYFMQNLTTQTTATAAASSQPPPPPSAPAPPPGFV